MQNQGPPTVFGKERASYGRDFAAQSPQEVASIIVSGDFITPVLSLQTLLIHA